MTDVLGVGIIGAGRIARAQGLAIRTLLLTSAAEARRVTIDEMRPAVVAL